MRRLIVIALALSACAAPVVTGFSAQRAALNADAPDAGDPTPTPTPLPVWVSAVRTAVAQREAACPTVPRGCFAYPPSCKIQSCFCPRFCAPRRFTGSIGRRNPDACSCVEG